MGEKKQLELRLEVKDITGAPSKDLTTLFEISDQSGFIAGKGQISFPLASATSKSLLSIFLKSGEKIIGFTKASLSTLFSESLSSKLDRFLKLKSEDYTTLRIKLAGHVAKIEIPRSKSSSNTGNSRRPSKAQRVVTCPYLENLTNGSGDMAALNELWKYRDQDSHTIKISLEPRSLMQEPVDHSKITVEQLRQLPGTALKEVVRSLCEESSQFSTISGDLVNKKKEFEDLVKFRRDLEFKSQEEVDCIQRDWIMFAEEYNQVLSNKHGQSQVLIEKLSENHELRKELDLLQATLLELKREHNIVFNQKLQYSDSNQSKEVLHELIEKSEKQKEEMEKKVLQAKTEFNGAQEECLKKIQGFKKEIEEIKLRTEEVAREEEVAKKENEKKKIEISGIKERLGNESEGFEKMQNEFDRLLEEFSQRKGVNEAIERKVSRVHKENMGVLENFQDLLDKKKEKKAEVDKIQSDIEQKTYKIQEIKKKILEEQIDKVSKEQICCLRADLAQLSEDLTSVKVFYSQVRPDLVAELDKGASLLIVESEKVLNQTEKADNIIDNIDKKEEELEGLKDVMGQAQKRAPPYIPVKDDLVDNALASYLNAKETPVPIKFIRQEGGNYLFGTKKIYIKIENGKLLIKVGGGFTNIDEFLWIYTPVELEKVDSSPRRQIRV